jgi:phosphoribosylformylglycinamidine (FGAM) synthase-like enzyme
VAAAESAFAAPGRLGCRLDLEGGIRADALLFGEAQSRILVTVEPARLPDLLDLAAKRGVAAAKIGTVGGNRVRIACAGTAPVDMPVEEARASWSGAIPAYFKIRES